MRLSKGGVVGDIRQCIDKDLAKDGDLRREVLVIEGVWVVLGAVELLEYVEEYGGSLGGYKGGLDAFVGEVLLRNGDEGEEVVEVFGDGGVQGEVKEGEGGILVCVCRLGFCEGQCYSWRGSRQVDGWAANLGR